MVTRRAALTAAAGFAGCTRLGGREGTDETATPTAGPTVAVDAPAFADGAAIPRRYTCDGENRSPALDVGELPAGATTVTLVVDDPDAGSEPFVHWLLWDVPASTSSIPAGIPRTGRVEELDGAIQGTNSADGLGYVGPCPPSGDGPHTYRFVVSAVEGRLGLDPGARRPAVDAALADRAVATGAVTGTYARS